MAAEVPNPNSDPRGQSAADEALRAAQEAIRSLQAMNAAPEPAASSAGAVGESEGASGDDVMAAMLAAMREDPGASGGKKAAPAPTASAMPLPDFGSGKSKALPSGMELLGDVNLNVRIELGRTKMLLEDVLRLGEGTVVELDKLAGDPVDIYVNDRPVARGEVLVLNDNFCIRVSEVYSKELIDRIDNSKPAA